MPREDKYTTGQIWKAQWPLCWYVLIVFVTLNKDNEPLYMAISYDDHRDESLNAPGVFFREYNNQWNTGADYLFTESTLNILLGMKAKLLDKKFDFVDKEMSYA